jgi:hypothetical protein
MKHKHTEVVPYGTEHYVVVGVDEATQKYFLEPQTGDPVDDLANRFWVDAKDID